MAVVTQVWVLIGLDGKPLAVFSDEIDAWSKARTMDYRANIGEYEYDVLRHTVERFELDDWF